jgi:hypothetical protein
MVISVCVLGRYFTRRRLMNLYNQDGSAQQ